MYRLHDIRSFGRAVYISLIICYACLLWGCHSSKPSGPTTEPSKREVSDALSELGRTEPEFDALAVRRAPAPPTLEIHAFVDLSLTMRPYAAPQPATAGGTIPAGTLETYKRSTYASLLRALSNQSELHAWTGWGSSKTGETTIPLGTAPTGAKLYTLPNNDYAALIDTLPRPHSGKPGVAPVHLIISDGVESQRDPAAGATLGPTARCIQKWVADGGAVELRLFTGPYYGTYYSESDRRPDPSGKTVSPPHQLDESHRPFMLLALLDSPEALPAWQDFWARGEFAALQPVATPLAVPVPPTEKMAWSVRPLEQIPPAELAPMHILGTKVWNLVEINLADQWRSVYAAKIVPVFASTAGAPLPVYFELFSSSAGGQSPAKGRWTPRLTAYSKASSPASNPARPNVSPVPAPRWEKCKNLGLEDQDPAVLPARTPNPAAPSSEGKSVAVFRYLIRSDAPRPLLCHFSVSTPGETAGVPDYSRWSTNDDAAPQNAARIYQLGTLVEQIARVGSTGPAVSSCGCVVDLY